MRRSALKCAALSRVFPPKLLLRRQAAAQPSTAPTSPGACVRRRRGYVEFMRRVTSAKHLRGAPPTSHNCAVAVLPAGQRALRTGVDGAVVERGAACAATRWMAAALIDRLLHRFHIVNIRGNSYRMRGNQEPGQIRPRGPSRGRPGMIAARCSPVATFSPSSLRTPYRRSGVHQCRTNVLPESVQFSVAKVSSFKLLLTDVPAGLPCVARASQARGGQPRGWIAAISGIAAAGVGRGGWLPHRRRVWDRSRFGDFRLAGSGRADAARWIRSREALRGRGSRDTRSRRRPSGA